MISRMSMLNPLIRSVFILMCSLSIAFSAQTPVVGQSGQPQKGASSVPGTAKPRPIPFHGTLAAVNPSLKTITIGKRTFVITPETKVYKGDKKFEATLKDTVVGGAVTGSYVKAGDGKLLARSIYFKPAAGAPIPVTPPARR